LAEVVGSFVVGFENFEATEDDLKAEKVEGYHVCAV